MKYKLLLDRIHEIQDLRKAARVLTWDREVNMPSGGDHDRTFQIATLQRLSHAMYISDKTGELIEAAANELNGSGYISKQASLIRFLRRDYALARKLPPNFVSRLATLNNQATFAWKKARQESDFKLFEPWLQQVVAVAQEQAERLGYEEERYDALINQYEPGAKTAEVKAVFNAVKEALLPLYQDIYLRKNSIDDHFLYQSFDVEKQQYFARYLVKAVGYDLNRGHMATAVHPFSTSFSTDDVRITIRSSPEYLSTAMFAALHEAGHAIYVQNIDPELRRTPLAKETSAGLDESQSRLIENMVGRSRGFWHRHFSELKRLFQKQLADVTVEQFYRSINKVQPGFIRVEADELTYNLHIILRFELELALIGGSLEVADLPDAWNSKMQSLLGIVPLNDRLGCLQDIHWTMVGFGYFPTYTLGNLYAAQFFEAALTQNSAIADELSLGQIRGLLKWLRENIHRHGRKLTPAELTLRATGSPLRHDAFVQYITKKFGELYGL